MTNFLLIVTCIYTSFNCGLSATKLNHNSQEKQHNVTSGRHFFNYDQIDFYRISLDKKNTSELLSSEPKSLLDSIKVSALLGETPTSIDDTFFIDKLIEVGYTKQKLSNKKFSSIDSVFIEKVAATDDRAACIYIYRDILVFKKQNKITGIAKICFSCKASYIVGTDANTVNFGRDGDYDKLQSILYK